MRALINAGPEHLRRRKHSSESSSAGAKLTSAVLASRPTLLAVLILLLWSVARGVPAYGQGQGILQALQHSSLYVDPDLSGRYSDQDLAQLQGILAADSKRAGYTIKAAMLNGAPSDMDAFHQLAQDYHDSLNLGKGVLILVTPDHATAASDFFNRKQTEQKVAAARPTLNASLFGGTGFLATKFADDIVAAKTARHTHHGVVASTDESDAGSGPTSAWTGWILVLIGAIIIFYFLHRRHMSGYQQKSRFAKLASRIGARIREMEPTLGHLAESPQQQNAVDLWNEASRKLQESQECISGSTPDYERCRRLIRRSDELLNEAQDQINAAESPVGVK